MKTYTIHKRGKGLSLDPTFPARGWESAETAAIGWFHPASCAVRPQTYFRALYDDRNIYVRFDVMDTFVSATRTRLHSSVCEDSCVELFIQPPGDESYFNFEINAIGTMLLYHVSDWRRLPEGGFRDYSPVPEELCRTVEIHHSIQGPTSKPIVGPCAWTVTYRIPLSLFAHCKGPCRIRRGDEWRGNMFKCGGSDHWGCWSPIGRALNFHQPKYFGTIVFD